MRVGEKETTSDRRLVGAAGTSGELAKRRRLQRKNFNMLSLPKRKELLQFHKVSSCQVRQKGKGKKQSVISSDRERERVKVSESRILAKKGGSEWEHGKESVNSTVKEDRFSGGEGGQAKRTSLGEFRVSMGG